MPCTHCTLPLDRSHYSPDRRLKSCTGCSQKRGEHVYHPVEEFGQHDPETDAPHSECDGCRSQLRVLAAQGYTAKEFPYADRLELVEPYVTIWTAYCAVEFASAAPITVRRCA